MRAYISKKNLKEKAYLLVDLCEEMLDYKTHFCVSRIREKSTLLAYHKFVNENKTWPFNTALSLKYYIFSSFKAGSMLY